jgi:hypothetical protein
MNWFLHFKQPLLSLRLFQLQFSSAINLNQLKFKTGIYENKYF